MKPIWCGTFQMQYSIFWTGVNLNGKKAAIFTIIELEPKELPGEDQKEIFTKWCFEPFNANHATDRNIKIG